MDTTKDIELVDILRVKGVNAKGYGIIPKAVMQDRRLSIVSKSIYSYICSFAGSGETAFPSVKKIMFDLDIKDVHTFSIHRNKLIKFGYITIERTRLKGKFKSNIYTLVQFPECSDSEEETKCEKTTLGKETKCGKSLLGKIPSRSNSHSKSNITKDLKINSIKDLKETIIITEPEKPKDIIIEPFKNEISVDEYNQFKKHIENRIGQNIYRSVYDTLLKKASIDTIKFYVDNWDKFKEHVNDYHKDNMMGVFVNTVLDLKDIPKKKLETSNNHQRIDRQVTFDQRKYSDEFYNSLYENGE